VKRLVLLRHAKAEKDAPRRADAARPLAARGESDAVEIGRRLALSGTHPDAIVSSPARRALETAKIVARELDFPWSEIRLVTKVYLANLDTLMSIVQSFEDSAETVVLVGHNPGLSELAQELVRRFSEDLPTCGAATVDCAADTWAGVRPGSGSLRRYDRPGRRG
jgi:phosphohistidine phosphatase